MKMVIGMRMRKSEIALVLDDWWECLLFLPVEWEGVASPKVRAVALAAAGFLLMVPRNKKRFYFLFVTEVVS